MHKKELPLPFIENYNKLFLKKNLKVFNF